MASITKRCRHPRDQWESCGCAWLLRQKIAGRDTYRNLGPDRAKAERLAKRILGEPSLTVTELVDEWLADKQADPNARPNSIAVYRARAKHIRAWFGRTEVRRLRPQDLEQFTRTLLEAGAAPATVHGIYAALTNALKLAVRRGVIKALPVPIDGPRIPTPRARSHDLTLAQVEEILARMPGRWGKVAELVYLTGLRWGEAVAIRPEDIQGDAVTIRRTANRYHGTNDPKTRAGHRVVPLSPRARAVLADLELPVGGDYRQARDALVAAMGDHHRTGMGWHTLRNAHATLLDAAGMSLRESAARMGHGAHYAQTLAYGVRSEVGSADALDAVRASHVPGDGSPAGAVVPLSAARGRRPRRARGD